MSFAGTGQIWMNGKLVEWKDATIHIASHVIHYGSGVFEGARCYATPKGSAVFRLDEHMVRLVNSAKIYRMEYPLDLAGWRDAVLSTIRANKMKACYIRPLVYRGYDTLGVNPLPNPVDAAIMLWEWGAYLGADALENGVEVCVSSWQRVAPNTIPALAKAGGNYLSSTLVSLEAKQRGFAEGIALATDGTISEGAGENVFLVRDGVVFTPPATASILTGITRASIITLARAAGIEVVEQALPREMLYIADEMFLTGTAAEITPVRSVDRITVGGGSRGPVTRRLQEAFFGLFSGQTADQWGWLEPVESAPSRSAAAS